MLLMVYPQFVPTKGQPPPGSGGITLSELSRPPAAREGGMGSGAGGGGGASAALKADRYEPRIFGFRVNEEAKLARWRQAKRDT